MNDSHPFRVRECVCEIEGFRFEVLLQLKFKTLCLSLIMNGKIRPTLLSFKEESKEKRCSPKKTLFSEGDVFF